MPYESLVRFDEFEVIRARDIFNKVLNADSVESTVIPDHSILLWKLKVNYTCETMAKDTTLESCYFTKYDISNIPEGFMMDGNTWALLNETVTCLEYNQNDQKQVDEAYSGFCNILKEQMNTHLKPRIVVVGRNNKKKASHKEALVVRKVIRIME